jgi:hypothetical protein
MNPFDQAHMTLALAMGEGPIAALDTMAEAALIMATGKIPDTPRIREGLDAWGLKYEEGPRINRAFMSDAALKVELPPGWKVSRAGGGGHHNLLDDRGASRLWWHISGFDSISTRVDNRFSIRRENNINASKAIIPILDGPTTIHTIPVNYPHPRINKPFEDGAPYYKNGYEGEDEGWTKEMSQANYQANTDARKAAENWLNENYAGHHDALTSWTL